jgi:hypothetical protein
MTQLLQTMHQLAGEALRLLPLQEIRATDRARRKTGKESFLRQDDPLHGKFARLTAQEEKQGLLDDPSGIGTRDGWGRRLAERGFALRGHRLVRVVGKQGLKGQTEAQG